MRKYCFFVWLFAMIALLSVNAETVALPKIHYDGVFQKPEVPSTGSWSKMPAAGSPRVRRTPGTLAARLAEDGVIFTWMPSPDSSRLLQAADLVDAAISEDDSLLIIAERIGGKGKNNSTRFVFVDLVNGNICGGFELSRRHITAIGIIPGMPDKIIAVQRGQHGTGMKNALLLIDLKSKKVGAEIGTFARPIVTFACDGEKIWFALKNSDEILSHDISSDLMLFHRSQVSRNVKKLFYHRNSKSLVAWEQGMCEYFSLKPNLLFLEHKLALPGNFTPAWSAVVPDIANGVVAISPEGKGVYFSPSGRADLPGKLDAYGCILPGNQIITGSFERMKLAHIQLPDGILKGFYAPNSLRPHNRNKTRFLFARRTTPAELIQVDERGNVFKITLTGRRGRKAVLLLVDKQGIK